MSDNNLTNAFTFLEKLVSEFSWKRTARLSILIFAVFAVLFLYEQYSGHIRLSRLSKATALLKELKEASGVKDVTASPELKKVYDGIVTDLGEFANVQSSQSAIMTVVWNGIAAFMPWGVSFILLHYINKSEENGPEKTRGAILGAMILAIPFTIIGAFIPYISAWINFVLYPIGHFVILVSLVLIWSKYSNKTG